MFPADAAPEVRLIRQLLRWTILLFPADLLFEAPVLSLYKAAVYAS